MYGTRAGVRALGLGACASAVAYKLTDTATSDLMTQPSLKLAPTAADKLSGSELAPSKDEKFLGVQEHISKISAILPSTARNINTNSDLPNLISPVACDSKAATTEDASLAASKWREEAIDSHQQLSSDSQQQLSFDSQQQLSSDSQQQLSSGSGQQHPSIWCESCDENNTPLVIGNFVPETMERQETGGGEGGGVQINFNHPGGPTSLQQQSHSVSQGLEWRFSLQADSNNEIISPNYEDDPSNIDSGGDGLDQGERGNYSELYGDLYNVQNVVSQRQQIHNDNLKKAHDKARNLCWRKLYESGSIGMVVSISVNGKTMFTHGFGYADLENSLIVGTGCQMRIASISKSITMAVLAKLVEENKVDLDASIRKYVPEWPEKEVDGEKVDITLRQLCSHLAGVRHYTKKGEDKESDKDKNAGGGDGKFPEFHLNKKFATTKEAIGLFKDDELMHKPGSSFLYTTHGFTLLAAVIENVTGVPFDKYMKSQFKELGLKNTYLDEHDQIIYNRAKYYVRDEHHKLKNAPQVDNSYKWAGGGFLSNVHDLTRFGNAMLYSYQKREPAGAQPKDNQPAKPATKEDNKKTDQTQGGEGENINEKPSEPQNNVETNKPTTKEQKNPDTNNTKCVASPTPQQPTVDSECSTSEKSEIHPVEIPSSTQSQSFTEDIHSESYESQDSLEYETLVNEDILVDDVEESGDAKASRVVYHLGPNAAVNKKNGNGPRYLPAYLKRKTMLELWQPVPGTKLAWGGDNMYYGLGWGVRPREKNFGYCKDDDFVVVHTGGAVGASSVLLIAPKNTHENETSSLPKGTVVAILCNMQGVGLAKLALELAKSFEGLAEEKPPARVNKIYQC